MGPSSRLSPLGGDGEDRNLERKDSLCWASARTIPTLPRALPLRNAGVCGYWPFSPETSNFEAPLMGSVTHRVKHTLSFSLLLFSLCRFASQLRRHLRFIYKRVHEGRPIEHHDVRLENPRGCSLNLCRGHFPLSYKCLGSERAPGTGAIHLEKSMKVSLLPSLLY